MDFIKVLKSGVAVAVFCLSGNALSAECKKEDAKAAVEKACSLIAEKGKSALRDIAKYRYCGSNYVWIQDKEVKMVLHPIKPRLNGKSLLENKDEKGKKLFVAFEKTARSNANGGWEDYLWAKPGAEKATAKTSFIKVCGGGLGWIAGSGVWK